MAVFGMATGSAKDLNDQMEIRISGNANSTIILIEISANKRN
jgi:hypothetical protein